MRRVILPLLVLFASSCAPPESLPDLRLPTLVGNTGASLAACPTPKCLTVYVAPWCGYCRRATPLILQLRRHLSLNNVATRVIVGMDQARAVEDYARDFGPDTLLDIEGAMRPGGVPHFYVSDAQGAVLKAVPGLPRVDDIEGLASYLGLP